ncbi:MAG: hypothetical protein DRN96_04760 [Thermoproteota archaeon]|nr:MAG: hypothetical protein DRN96_04760 [Candidatus Korarchaeota archaeon]
MRSLLRLGRGDKINVEEEEWFFRRYLERRKGVASLPTFLEESKSFFGSDAHSMDEGKAVLEYFTKHWACYTYKRRGVAYYVFPEFVPESVVNWIRRAGREASAEFVSKYFGYSEIEAEIIVDYVRKFESEDIDPLTLRLLEAAEKANPVGFLKEAEAAKLVGAPLPSVQRALAELAERGAVEVYEDDGEKVYVFREAASKDKLNTLRVMRLRALRLRRSLDEKLKLMEKAYRDRLRLAREVERRVGELQSEARRLERHIRALEAERQALAEAGRAKEAEAVKAREIQLIRSKKRIEDEIGEQESYIMDVKQFKIELIEQRIKLDKIERLIKDLELKIRIGETIPSPMGGEEDIEQFIEQTRRYLEEEYKEVKELEREVFGIEEEPLLEEAEVSEEVLSELEKVEKEVRVMRQREPLEEAEQEA